MIPGCSREKASTIAQVSSAEQSSQMMISCTGADWATMLRSCSCTNLAPLYVHIATEKRDSSMSQGIGLTASGLPHQQIPVGPSRTNIPFLALLLAAS